VKAATDTDELKNFNSAVKIAYLYACKRYWLDLYRFLPSAHHETSGYPSKQERSK
jgi:hypothetical protein